jgi:hypothetical protein
MPMPVFPKIPAYSRRNRRSVATGAVAHQTRYPLKVENLIAVDFQWA